MKLFELEFDELAETRLCKLMKQHGSDKGGEGASHSYTPVYHALFESLAPRHVFELGVYSGASLRAWHDYFPHATVYGADNERQFLFQEHRIHTVECDETVAASVESMWASLPDMDIMVDDALHTIEANLFFLERSFTKLQPGGIYIVEDLVAPDRYVPAMDSLKKMLPIKDYEIVRLPLDRNHYNDNNLLIVRHT